MRCLDFGVHTSCACFQSFALDSLSCLFLWTESLLAVGMYEVWSQCKPKLVIVDIWEICFRCILLIYNVDVPPVSFFPVVFSTISNYVPASLCYIDYFPCKSGQC